MSPIWGVNTNYTSMSVRAKYEHDLHLLVRVEEKNGSLDQAHLGLLLSAALLSKELSSEGSFVTYHPHQEHEERRGRAGILVLVGVLVWH